MNPSASYHASPSWSAFPAASGSSSSSHSKSGARSPAGSDQKALSAAASGSAAGHQPIGASLSTVRGSKRIWHAGVDVRKAGSTADAGVYDPLQNTQRHGS